MGGPQLYNVHWVETNGCQQSYNTLIIKRENESKDEPRKVAENHQNILILCEAVLLHRKCIYISATFAVREI